MKYEDITTLRKNIQEKPQQVIAAILLEFYDLLDGHLARMNETLESIRKQHAERTKQMIEAMRAANDMDEDT